MATQATTASRPNTYAETREEAARKLPWHVMGNALSVKAKTVDAALTATGLDYEVRLVEMTGRGTQPLRAIEAPGIFGVVRPFGDEERVIAAVGKRYTPIQNREAFAPANYLVSEFGARITGAADFRSGTASLLVVDLAEPVVLRRPDGGEDVTDLDLLIRNDHGGNAALTFALTGMRLACTNAVQAAIKNAPRAWKISHTPNYANSLAIASDAITKAVTYKQEFQTIAQTMLDTKMVDAEFDKIVAGLWPVKAADETKAGERRREIQSEVRALYHDSPTLEGVRGTRWGGYHAITEWLDWARPVRGGDVSRAEGALEGPYVRRKAKVWETFAKV